MFGFLCALLFLMVFFIFYIRELCSGFANR